MGKRKKPPVSRKEKRKLKRANKKQNKRDWFLKQHKKAAGTSTGASLIIQQQQEEIERLRHELQAKESKTKKKKKKRRGLTYEELNSKRDNRESIEFEEDKEIEYLETKLMGSKGGNSQKLMNELLEEDGYENDFLNLLDDIEKIDTTAPYQQAEEGKMTKNYRFQEDVSSSSDASSSDSNSAGDEEVPYNDAISNDGGGHKMNQKVEVQSASSYSKGAQPAHVIENGDDDGSSSSSSSSSSSDGDTSSSSSSDEDPEVDAARGEKMPCTCIRQTIPN